MGIPDELNNDWKDDLEDYIAQNNPDVTKTGDPDDMRVARIHYDKNKNVCTDELPGYTPVYKIPIKYLWYNAYSSRLGQWKEVAKDLDQNVKADRNLIKTHLLGKQKQDFFKKLSAEGQDKVAIALADGVLIDGNRRMANLEKNGTKDMYVVILPDNLPRQQAFDIEAVYSDEDDGSELYSPVERGRQFKEYLAEFGSWDSVAKKLKKLTAAEIKEQADAFDTAVAYAKLKGWKINPRKPCSGSNIDVDRVEDGSKKMQGPGFDIFDRINKKLPKARKGERSKLMMGYFAVVRGTKERDDVSGGVDNAVDDLHKAVNSAAKKAKFLQKCKLYKPNQMKHWDQNDMHDEILQTQGAIINAHKTTSSVDAVKSARNSLNKAKASGIKTSDTTTKDRLKEIKAKAVTLLGKWDKKK